MHLCSSFFVFPMNTVLGVSFFLLLSLFTEPVVPFSHTDHYTKPSDLSLRRHHRPQEHLEVTYPLPSEQATPSCSHLILRHSFADTIDSPPFSTPYIPPSHCPSPWSRALLRFQADCKGEQYDRIAGLWLGGVELFRTSTAEPTKDGVFWNVWKDVTRYSSLLTRSDLDLTMMLENIVNHEFTGIYHVTITLSLFKGRAVVGVPLGVSCEGRSRILRDESDGGISEVTVERDDLGDTDLRRGSLDSYESPADLIIPISDDGDRGFWFRIERESDVHSRSIRIPKNTHRAVLELCASFHGNDEFWYSNPPNSYIKTNGLSTRRGNGAYREVYVTIDGEVVGSEVPFPVIFTGGINPLLWEPVVAIGAFNLPSYDIDLTPYLGKILGGKKHRFGIGVTRGISYWLVNANLHLWLDHHSQVVHAGRIINKSPEVTIERQEEFTGLDGSFDISAEREGKVAGWVRSSAGNLTTVILHEFKFKNYIKFQKNGTYKLVKQKHKAKKKTKLINGHGQVVGLLKVKRKYPLRVLTWTKPCLRKDRYLLVTNVTHALRERQSGACFSSSISNKQDSSGWMKVKGHSVVAGQAITRQNYTYADRFNCYARNVAAADGKLIEDSSTFQCEQ
ncbi:peptide-N4-(N-acetyl-beta-glucosaminyl)asparagine amidase A-like [Neltuma alba]|uniref:peptide-N4-(N-acetyl-beta- glucosaminyl)asparagine amidase A-like n=1 Tax=Neltuma alba TaxID=207710 RepID=UPI0010A2DD98|nr:peptide-N4-(N-acetyl-beta-glucosaminyl)asparagine amidase A-like [Prosopis alba]